MAPMRDNTISRPVLGRGLYLILTEPRDGYENLARLAVQAELPALQLRYKGGDDFEHRTLARKLRNITKNSRTLFIVNDRPDIALESDADGVHVGQSDLSVAEVRAIVGSNRLVGLSTHALDQVVAANDAPVDYIGFGPLFATASKADADPVVGPNALKEAHRLSLRPVVAIGGLTLERVRALTPYAHNAAVIRAVADAKDPLAAMREIDAAFPAQSFAHF